MRKNFADLRSLTSPRKHKKEVIYFISNTGRGENVLEAGKNKESIKIKLIEKL